MGKLKKFFTFLAGKLANSSSGFICNEKLTVADFSVYGALKSIRNGGFDYIATDYDSAWPVFQTYVDKLESDAVFSKYAF